jgi:glycosyltransferase involved in cell wall biosynthesis
MALQASQATRPKIAFLMHLMQVAGAEVLVTQIIDRLKERFDFQVICLDGLGQLGEQLLERGTSVVVLGRKPGIDWQTVSRLRNCLRKESVDLLHAHQYTPFFYAALARMTGAWRTKILMTEHGRFYPDIVSWKRRLTNRLVLTRACDHATACSRFSAEALRVNDGFSKVETLYNGVDIQQMAPRGTDEKVAQRRRKLGLRDDRLYVACIARFHPVKDHLTLIKAWPEVIRRTPHARLLLVGDGPQGGAIRKLIDELKISDSIEFWGIRHDVAEILRAVDLFVLPSLSEAASLTLLEAMSCQCPPVVTEVGGNPEHVTDGVEGRLVPRGDSVRMSEAIVDLLGSASLRRSMGLASRQRVIDAFDLNQAIERYAELYSTLTNKRPG